VLAVVTPDFMDPLVETAADNAFYFLLLIALILLLLNWSTSLDIRMRDHARSVWRETLSVGGVLPSPPATSWVQALRTSNLYRRPMRFLKWRIMPLLAALAILALAALLAIEVYTQLRLHDL
jgi:hypothetical protein